MRGPQHLGAHVSKLGRTVDDCLVVVESNERGGYEEVMRSLREYHEKVIKKV